VNVAVAHDDGEQVVEVVRDAAGQTADHFHFLGLAQLFLEVLVLGDVGPGAHDFHRLAVGVADQAALAANPAIRSVAVTETIFCNRPCAARSASSARLRSVTSGICPMYCIGLPWASRISDTLARPQMTWPSLCR